MSSALPVPFERQHVLRILAERSPGEHSGARIDGDWPLFEGGLELSSVDFLEVVVQIEAELGLVLREEDLGTAELASVKAFLAHVAAKAGA